MEATGLPRQQPVLTSSKGYTAPHVDVVLNLLCSKNALWSTYKKTSIECTSKPIYPHLLYVCEQFNLEVQIPHLKGDQRDH